MLWRSSNSGYLCAGTFHQLQYPAFSYFSPFRTKSENDLLLPAYRAEGVAKIQLNILRYTGCRPSECIKLQIKDLDFDKKEILFRHTKTKKSRYVPMSSKIIENLKAHIKDKSAEDYLFPNETRHTLRDKLVKVIPKTCSHRVFLYAFRRYAASKLLDVTKGDIRLVSQLLGHSQIQTTLRYAMRPQEALKQAVELL